MNDRPMMKRRAHIEGAYRYTLERDWTDLLTTGPIRDLTLAFLMLNPSTADALEDDQTIIRCINFAKRLKLQRIVVVNLFAYRTPYPAELAAARSRGVDIVGEKNDATILATLDGAAKTVCAWGSASGVDLNDRVRHVAKLLGNRPLWSFGLTKTTGQPLHPARLPSELDLRPFRLDVSASR